MLARTLLCVQSGDLLQAETDASTFHYGEARTSVAFEARRHLANGLVLAQRGDVSAASPIESGTTLARRQGAILWVRYGATLGALADRVRDPSQAVIQASRESPVVLSMLAEPVLTRLNDLTSGALEIVIAEATRRPWRWRASTRRHLEAPESTERIRMATLLEAIGERQDIQRLRNADRGSRDRRASKLGLGLARRLADPVLIDDLGRVRILSGSRIVEGSEVRRKVLALLCLLVSRSRFTSTREEVIDALWPENDPQSALNSLNQTVYFLRRVFEPDYSDETSPGYVGQDGETIWLDPDLVESRSGRCLDIIRTMPGDRTRRARSPWPPNTGVASPSTSPTRSGLGRIATRLHAAYLRVMERAIRIDLNTGHLDRGTFIAERAAEIDPEAEEIQTALIGLYQLSGAHAAAAERYAHYERSMRDLGLDPVPFTEV